MKGAVFAVMLLALCARSPTKRDSTVTEAPLDAGSAAPISQAEESYRAGKAILDSENGSSEVAQKLLDRALELDATLALAHVELARCTVRQGFLGGKSYSAEKLHQALHELELAFELAPDLLEGHLERADICRRQGDASCVRDESTRIAALVPESYEAEIVNAWLAELEGRDSDTVTYTQRALPHAQSLLQQRQGLELMARHADAASAAAAYQKLLALVPDSAAVKNDYCAFITDQQDWARAYDACTDALKRSETPAARENLGEACKQRGSKLLGQVDPHTLPMLECAFKNLPENPAVEVALSQALTEQALKDRSLLPLERAEQLINAAAGHGASDAAVKKARDIVTKARARITKK